MGILDLIIEENKQEAEEKVNTKNFSLVGSICPSCKVGTMELRVSKYGEFLGCNNFPRCAYAIDEKYDNNIGTAGHKI